MSYYIITGDFFTDEVIPVPDLKFELVTESPSSPYQCMCLDVEKRVLGGGIGSDEFTLVIFCRSRDDARNAEIEHKTRHGDLKMGRAAQRRMFFDLKNLCECYSVSFSSDSAPNFKASERTFSRASWSSTDTTSQAEKQAKQPEIATVFSRTGYAKALSQLDPVSRKRIINEEIIKQISNRIEPSDVERRDGRIYWIESSSNPGKLLIDCCFKDTPDFAGKVVKRCPKDARLIAFTPKLPNAKRIMKLIMSELQSHTQELVCATCSTRHQSWYAVDVDLAEIVILRWSTWMAGQPYQSWNGQLRKIWIQRVNDAKLRELDPVAKPQNGDTNTWGWWTGLLEEDVRKGLALVPQIKVKRMSL